MTELQAVICGYYGHGNGGDEALMVSVLEMLPPEVKPLVLSAKPRQTNKDYGVKSRDRMNSFQLLEALRESQVLILGGGSLIQDATSSRNSIYYGGLLGLAQQFGLKTIALSQGIGPLNGNLSRWIAKRAFGGCHAISVRDAASATILQEWNISSIIAPDLVWNLSSYPVVELTNLPYPRIAITLRNHPQLTPQRLHNLIEALIALQKATESYILIIPFQPSTDLAIANEIQSHLPLRSKIVSYNDPRQLKGAFTGVQLAIGMRYHSLIMAAAEQCPCFALSYDPKVSKLMKEIDISGWELTNIPDDPEVIFQTWLTEFNSNNYLSSDRLAEIQQKANLHHELLNTALEN